MKGYTKACSPHLYINMFVHGVNSVTQDPRVVTFRREWQSMLELVTYLLLSNPPHSSILEHDLECIPTIGNAITN